MVKQQPGNPLWVSWIKDLANVAEQKGNKACHTYNKAAAALKSNPITFTHPEETRHIVGIGPAIISHLVTKLKAHCEENGLEMPPRVYGEKKRAGGDGDEGEEVPKKRKTKKKKGLTEEEEQEIEDARDARRQRTLGGNPNPVVPVRGGGGGGADTTDDEAPAPAPAKKKRTTTTNPNPKAYVPRKGSGAYAILLSLYSQSSYDDHGVWLLIRQITEVAQQYSENSFEKVSAAPGAGGQGAGTYTAWNGNKTLLTKKLVEEDHKSPRHYRLTEEGYILAHSLAPAAGIPQHQQAPSSSASGNYYNPNHHHRPPTNGTNAFASGSGGGGQRLGGRNDSEVFNDDYEENYEEELDRALEESRRQAERDATRRASNNGGGGSGRALVPVPVPKEGGHPSSSSSTGGFRPAMMSGNTLDGRKAAMGTYAQKVWKEDEGPKKGNVDLPFGYYYLDVDDNRVHSRSSAEVSQDEKDLSTLFRIEYRVAQALHPMMRSVTRPSPLVRTTSLPGGITKSGFIKLRSSNEVAPGFLDGGSGGGGGGTKRKELEKTTSSDAFDGLMGGYTAGKKVDKRAMYDAPPEVRRLGSDGNLSMPIPAPRAMPTRPNLPATTTTTTSARANNNASTSTSTSSTAAVARPIPRAAPAPVRPPNRPLARSTSSQHPLFTSFDSHSLPTRSNTLNPTTIINRHPLDPVTDHQPKTPYTFTPFNPILLPRGSFEVVLIVDTRELGLGHKKNREGNGMVEDLLKLGVKTEKRMLSLGDMIWVARRKDGGAGGRGGAGDVVLDAVVERKRLDDLVGSIKDGRYVGQKLRMKNSAITQRFYLIEQYDKTVNYATMGKAIWTIKSQLQVNDGFFVHESNDYKDTLSYLKMRTDIMIDMYENTDLHVIPDLSIERQTYLSLQKHLRSTEPSKKYLTTYATYEALNNTNATLTLRTTWATMIQRVNGIGSEKAVQVLDQWETPGELWEDSVKWREGREWEGEGMGKKAREEDFVVERLGGKGGTRGIKKKLGEKVYELFAARGQYGS